MGLRVTVLGAFSPFGRFFTMVKVWATGTYFWRFGEAIGFFSQKHLVALVWYLFCSTGQAKEVFEETPNNEPGQGLNNKR
jgi:putative NADPH-quinone reductase